MFTALLELALTLANYSYTQSTAEAAGNVFSFANFQPRSKVLDTF